LRTYSALLTAITVPIALVMIAFSGAIVRGLFQRGAFSAADTHVVAGVQAMYVIQIPFYAVQILHARFLLAMKRSDLVMCSAGLNLAVNIVANIVLMRRFGVAGIALATSAFYVASFAFLLYFSSRLLGQQTVTVPVAPMLAGDPCD
jgi:putative peptidoglycan lipid II flippase